MMKTKSEKLIFLLRVLEAATYLDDTAPSNLMDKYLFYLDSSSKRLNNKINSILKTDILEEFTKESYKYHEVKDYTYLLPAIFAERKHERVNAWCKYFDYIEHEHLTTNHEDSEILRSFIQYVIKEIENEKVD